MLVYDKSFSQLIRIPLVNKYDSNGLPALLRGSSEIKNPKGYVGFDSTSYALWSIRTCNFNNKQALKESVLSNNLTQEAYLSIIETSKDTDTSYVFQKNIPRNKFSVFTGIDKKGLKYVIVDANGNKDFSDDKCYTFDLTQERKYPKVDVEIDYFDGVKISTAIIRLKLNVYDTYFVSSDNREKKLTVTFSYEFYKEGAFTSNNNTYLIRVGSYNHFLYRSEAFKLIVSKVPVDTDPNNVYIYSSRDSIVINKTLYKVDKIFKDTLYLIGIRKVSGVAEVDELAPEILGTDILTKQNFSFRNKRGNYLIIDFWGSWCKPCIALLPDLVRIKNKYRDKGLKILSIAYDKVADLDKLKLLINNSGLEWEHLLVDRNGSQQIVKDYKVQTYPTTFLINPSGKIIYRGVGSKALQEIDDYLIAHY